MRKSVFFSNRGADQLHGNRAVEQRIFFYIVGTLPVF